MRRRRAGVTARRRCHAEDGGFQGSLRALGRLPYSFSVQFGRSLRSMFSALRFPTGCLLRPSGAMWRSCLRLPNRGRRLLNRSPGGPTASVGPKPNTRSPSRDYAPPAGEGGQGTPHLARGGAGLSWAEGFGNAGWGTRGSGSSGYAV